MKQVLTLVSLLLLFASAVAAQENGSVQNESSWQRYTVKGEDFSIKLPLLPAMATIDDFRSDETLSSRVRQLGAYADGVAYTIYILDNGNPNKAFKNFVREISSQRWEDHGKEVTVNGFVGNQYSAVHPLGGTLQVFATNKRFYQVQAFGASEDDPRVKPFFASLLLGEKSEAVEVSDGHGVPYEPGTQSTTQVFTEKIYIGKEVDRKAVLAMKPEPMYTRQAKQRGIEGTVVLKVVFAANGSITNIRTVSGLSAGLTENAIDAARKIKFIPAVKDGKYVSMWYQLEYNFNLY